MSAPGIHPCVVPGCRLPLPPERLMCRAHWTLVPPSVQREVWASYTEGMRAGTHPTPAWHVATDEAIEAVQHAEEEKAARTRGEPRSASSGLRGLTLQQPFGLCIVGFPDADGRWVPGPKRNENRGWPAPGFHLDARGRRKRGAPPSAPLWIAIHAGAEEYKFPPCPPPVETDVAQNSREDLGGSGWKKPLPGWMVLRHVWPALPPPPWTKNAILGLAEVFDVVRDDDLAVAGDPWTFGPLVWRLRNVVPCPTPIPCKGALGLWRIRPSITTTLRELYRAALADGRIVRSEGGGDENASRSQKRGEG